MFIGTFTKEQATDLVEALETCLLTDSELIRGPAVWKRWADPFSVPAESGTA